MIKKIIGAIFLDYDFNDSPLKYHCENCGFDEEFETGIMMTCPCCDNLRSIKGPILSRIYFRTGIYVPLILIYLICKIIIK